jgi:1-acyl-sn-glycerol-3-phosphate acyltransferase
MAAPSSKLEPELVAGLHGRATAEPGLTYRFLRRLWGLIAAALGARLVLEGAEHLPRDPSGGPVGGWIGAGMSHLTWVDPFVPWVLLPARPRMAFFGDARTMARSPLRRFIMARLGGVIPIPAGRDPRTVDVHLAAAREVLRAGAIFMLFPEIGPAAGPANLRRFKHGIGYVALRNRAPIVPLVLGGNHELYFGRRILLRVLPAMDPLELAGLDPAGPLPLPGTPAERDAVRRLAETLHDRCAPVVVDLHQRAEPPSGTRKRGRFLTKLFR